LVGLLFKGFGIKILSDRDIPLFFIGCVFIDFGLELMEMLALEFTFVGLCDGVVDGHAVRERSTMN
jgi:hypothetical protein